MYSGETVHPDTGLSIYAAGGNTAPMDGSFFTLVDGELFRWAPGEAQPALYCTVPAVPPGLLFENRDDVPEESANQLSRAVTQIAGGDGALWAFNAYALRVGRIDETGVQWLPVTMDRSAVPPEWERFLRIAFCWVRDGQFECIADIADYERSGWMELAILRFDLETGAGSMTNLPDAVMACPYKPGSYLAYTAKYNDDYSKLEGALSAVDAATGEYTPLPLDIVGAHYAIGGLCYDGAADRICYAYGGEIWASVAGAPFESVGYLPVAYIYDAAPAWFLPGDVYAIVTGGLYTRNTGPQYRPQRTLRLQGVWNDETYKRFTKAYPDIPAIADYIESRAEEIAEAVRNGTSNVDVYSIDVDPNWRALIQKGFAADLSASKKLTEDVARMYPYLQEAFCDDAGKLMGYPASLSGWLWSVDEKLWERFDMGPLPVTYDQLLDCWLRWDAEFGADNPEIAFISGSYSRYSVVYSIIEAYIRRYEQPGQAPDMTSPLLLGLLEKVERLDFGDWTEEAMYGERNDEYNDWINRPALMSMYGNVGLMNNPEETTFRPADSEDLHMSNQIHSAPMLPPVFMEGEEPLFIGWARVLFANPASPNLDLAVAYIEGAVGAGYEVEYMSHPDVNDPREHEDFEKTVKEIRSYREEQAAYLGNVTSPLERKEVEERIDFYDRWLAEADKNKWAVSSGAIERMREFLPYMRLADRSVILTYDATAQYLFDLLSRYEEGQLSLDGFLRELNNTLRMVVLEGS